MKRTKRRNDRPLAEKIKDLLPLREPVYAQADIIVQSRDEPHDTIVDEIIAALPQHLGIDAGAEKRHDRAAAPASRTDRGAGRAGRARLRHRHRPRPDRDASARASRRCGRARACAIVTDETVARHHLAAAEAALKAAGIEAARIVVPDGEGSKSYADVRDRVRGDHRGAHRARRSRRSRSAAA